MKNLLLFLAMAIASTLFSQDNKKVSSTEKPKEKFSLGVQGGLTLNNMPSGKTPYRVEGITIKTQSEVAYFAGASARQPIGQQFAAILEAQFSVKGYNLPFPSGTQRHQFYYLDFVPQVEYKIFKNIHLSLGGYWGRRLEQRVREGDNKWTIVNPDIVEFVENNDFGLVSGLNVRFKKVYALLRYQFGLAPVSALNLTNENGQEIATQGQRNRSLQIGLGFKIL